MKDNEHIEQEQIEELIILYKELQSENSKEELKLITKILLDKFNNFIKAYVNIIDPRCEEEYLSLNDKKAKVLIYLFKNNNKKETTKKELIEYIRKPFLYEDIDDIISDFQIIFINKIRTYKKQDKNFCAYLNNVFIFDFARYIKKKMSNPLFNPNTLHYNENLLYSFGLDANYFKEIYPIDYWLERPYDLEDGKISQEWINGVDCEEPFKKFNKTERLVIVNYFEKKMSDKDIAISLDKHFNTISQIKLKAIKKLSDELNYDYIRTRRCRKIAI